MPPMLLKNIICLTAESWRFKILAVLDNLSRYLIGQNLVVVIQNHECFLQWCFRCAHNKRVTMPSGLKQSHAGGRVAPLAR